jgi:hypothetical protein
MTQKQLQANRLNARTGGPRSATGKARSAMNNLQTGIYAQSEILPGEDNEALEKLSAEFYEFYQPETPLEREVIDNLIHLAWLNRRYRRIDAQLMKYEIDTTYKLHSDCVWGQAFSSGSTRFLRLQTRATAADRAFHRNLDQLRLLEAERAVFESGPEPELSTNQIDQPVTQTE